MYTEAVAIIGPAPGQLNTPLLLTRRPSTNSIPLAFDHLGEYLEVFFGVVNHFVVRRWRFAYQGKCLTRPSVGFYHNYTQSYSLHWNLSYIESILFGGWIFHQTSTRIN